MSSQLEMAAMFFLASPGERKLLLSSLAGMFGAGFLSLFAFLSRTTFGTFLGLGLVGASIVCLVLFVVKYQQLQARMVSKSG